MQGPDSVYDQTRPWQGNEERLVGAALGATAGMTAEQIQQIRPPLPRVSLFPNRFGFEKRAVTVFDVMNLADLYPDARTDYSGNTSGNAGSSYPALGVM